MSPQTKGGMLKRGSVKIYHSLRGESPYAQSSPSASGGSFVSALGHVSHRTYWRSSLICRVAYDVFYVLTSAFPWPYFQPIPTIVHHHRTFQIYRSKMGEVRSINVEIGEAKCWPGPRCQTQEVVECLCLDSGCKSGAEWPRATWKQRKILGL